jgi:hypothetical protein
MKMRRTTVLRLCLLAAICLAAAAVLLFRSPGTFPGGAARNDSFPTSAKPTPAGADSSPAKTAQQVYVDSTRWKVASALDLISKQSDVSRQTVELQSLVNDLRVADISTVLDSLREGTSSHLRSELRALLVRRWTENDAPTAAAWVAQNLTGTERAAALNSVATVWAGQDFPAAENWARQLPDAEERSAVMLALAYEMNRENPNAALALAAELPESQNRDEFIVQSAGSWGALAFKESIEWAGQIPDESLRHRVLGAVAAAVAESDPSAAAKLAVESLPAGREQDDAIVGIVQRWVQKSPEQAAAWVAAFPDGNLRATALEALVKLWADKDLVGAGAWVDTLTSRASRDTAVAAYVEKLAVQFPEMAVEWAREIHNEQLRNERLENLAELWLRSNAAAAREWIAQAPLSAAAKSRLLAMRSE